MLKRILIVPIVLLLIVSFCNTAGATVVNSPNGYYQITGGKVKASVNFPSFFKITIDLPNLAMIKDLLGGCFVFYYWVDPYDNHVLSYDYGPFSFYLPLDLSDIPIPLANQPQAPLDTQTEFPIVGEWDMTASNKFAIIPADENGDPVDIAQTINDLLATQDFPLNMITAEVTKYSFTGTVNSNRTLKVNLALGILIDAFITTGTISLTGSFTTALPTLEPPEESFILSNTKSVPNGSIKGSSKDIANWVVKILKGLPLKSIIPAN